jgi:hypothetical protein
LQRVDSVEINQDAPVADSSSDVPLDND